MRKRHRDRKHNTFDGFDDVSLLLLWIKTAVRLLDMSNAIMARPQARQMLKRWLTEQEARTT